MTLHKVYTEESVYDAAIDRARIAFGMFDRISVLFSGGKDSTAVLNIALTVAHETNRLPLDVVFFDEEAIPYQTAEYVERMAARDDISMRWLAIPVKSVNACSRSSPWWYPYGPEDEDKWVRPLHPSAITDLPNFPMWPPESRPSHSDTNALLYDPREGRVGMMMGIRAAESLIRHRAVTGKVLDNWMIRYTSIFFGEHITRVYPVFDWSDRDVWTAPATFGWDYNRAYDLLEMAGLSRREQRCSPAFGLEPLGKLWTFHYCFPELWDRMIDRVPGARTAARYALTELYHYRTSIDKPDDMTWQEAILHQLTKWRPEERHLVAERLRGEIRAHYAKTIDPILDPPHPETGVGWRWLYLIAVRGDLKQRRQAGGNIRSEGAKGEAVQYAEALALHKAAS